MPVIHDVVGALGRREGVEAVVVLGNDGLPIASRVGDGVDPEVLSAMVPNIVQASEQLAQHAGRGSLTAGVFEFSTGFVILTTLSSDARLLILARPATNLGPLLYDLARYRAEIAGLL